MRKKMINLSASLLGVATVASTLFSCSTQQQESPMKAKVEEYAQVELKSDLVNNLNDKEKELVKIFFQVGEITDDLFWQQTFGDKSQLDTITDSYAKEFAMIHYGAWDRLDNNKPFLAGYGEKPAVCNYYPHDITAEEFDAFEDANKNSWYTVIRRNEDGSLKSVWYHEAYAEEIGRICALLEKAVTLAEDPGLKNYLEKRIEAFKTDDYLESDLAWMDMKDSKIDFVTGPIESYDDKFQETKASYESFILLKDEARSKDLAKFVAMLPALQKELPCAPEYKTFVPGTSSDLNVYDAVYYAGDCNAGSKTIAINLPNDERVHALKGTRRLQLRNSMKVKFDKILMPIGQLIVTPEQQKYLNFDAFFWNVTFHEVAHGLGVKQTINTNESVDAVMGTEKTSWEEAKADILGLFMVTKLIEMGEITNITAEDAIATYIAGILRSVRFGAASSHGKANMMCFNYMEKAGAFSRDAKGQYAIDFGKAKEAMNGWAALILQTQGDGNVEFATKYRAENGGITPALQADLDKINGAGIPRDITFIQGADILLGETK
ncbi:dipeptidyl-peptidase 3 family protein [Phocaeicola coprocola]|uniref:dipeptidyl-peptidase 3 family protein n=1 Tax=Phocaeicola coprocola TaxID=310298 RepID=UPI001C3875D1|nr:Zn-dependent hydrolase [Phocaeicola coprocola]MBV3866593.1 Zn-dependent hydrolase [Phocaeicola coprocola]MBV4006515.1 Zn-dependent hydrolase [Phocaeicola coprocola]MBV4032270.1 Zn-dependent hydrolase [Phocaeicola coprocola]MBV4038862.1 Zn-dependent hydrolase [Phocaeicola coprocola]MBV4060491.1 Zn-dependent hydrolase [Phocaeicola coprocola]